MKLIFVFAVLLLSPRLGEAGSGQHFVARINDRLNFEMWGDQEKPKGYSTHTLFRYSVVPALTHEVFFRSLPPREEFEFHLFDSGGKEIAKTRRGTGFSANPKPPTSKTEASRLKAHTVFYGVAAFRADEMFAVPGPGTYKLVVRIRVWAEDTARGKTVEPVVNNVGFVKAGYISSTNVHFSVQLSAPIEIDLQGAKKDTGIP